MAVTAPADPAKTILPVGPRAGEAVSCAVSIQQRLADHRRRHGFAPPVRIGLHTAEATVIP